MCDFERLAIQQIKSNWKASEGNTRVFLPVHTEEDSKRAAYE